MTLKSLAKLRHAFLFGVFILFAARPAAAQCTLSQASYTQSELGLIKLGQSFVACNTGDLTSISVYSAALSDISGVTLRVYNSASGYTNELTSQTNITLNKEGVETKIVLATSLAVKQDSVYSFSIEATIPPLLQINVSTTDAYTDGTKLNATGNSEDTSPPAAIYQDLKFGLDISVALPVELTFFRGIPYYHGNKLYWETASETNNKAFEVERSVDLEKWEKIAVLQGHGNKLTTSKYKYEDYMATHHKMYYRLKQIDYDGKFEYSDPIIIESGFGVNESKMMIFPNPAADEIRLKLSKEKIEYVNIRNHFGQVEKHYSTINTFQTILDISDLIPGLYFLELYSAEKSIPLQAFVKK